MMTTIRIPLRRKSKHCHPLQQTNYQADEPAAFDPTMDDKKSLMQRSVFFDREQETAHLERASSLWAGIHWYLDLHDRHRI